MSFVPAPQQANAAGASNVSNSVISNSAASAATAASAAENDADAIFKMRTFDVYWVDKSALMYRDGIAKVGSYVAG
jgi:hypothetical protein